MSSNSNWNKVVKYNLLLFCFFTIIGLSFLEIYLRIDGRYESVAGIDLKASNTVWSRYENNVEAGFHPDLKIPLELVYDDFSVRNHSGVSISNWESVIALFGDSFTENRRLDSKFTINEIVNDVIGRSLVANFGIDGFGLEQSIQRYINIKDSVNIKEAYYLFCANDLRNTYEVDLFDLDALLRGRFVNKTEVNKSAYEVARKNLIYALSYIHTVYFILETKAKWKGHFENAQALSGKLANFRAESRQDWTSKFHDSYADLIVDQFLEGSQDPTAIQTVEKFVLLLKLWTEMLSEDGVGFKIAPVSNDVERAVLRKLLVKADLQHLYVELPRVRDLPLLVDYDDHFSNDRHWNEMGNLAAAVGIMRESFGLTKIKEEQFVRRYHHEIIDYYSSYGKRPTLDLNSQ